MPPIMAATCWPTGNSPPGHWATTPAASIPGTRGNVTPDASPSRVCSSDRLRPNALTLISTHPAAGVETGSSRIVRASGGPGASRMIARIVPAIEGRSCPLLRQTGFESQTRPEGRGNPGHAGTLVGSGLPHNVVDRFRAPRTCHMAGAVRVSIGELDGIGISGGHHDPAEVMHGVVQGQDGRLLATVQGVGGCKAA